MNISKIEAFYSNICKMILLRAFWSLNQCPGREKRIGYKQIQLTLQDRKD